MDSSNQDSKLGSDSQSPDGLHDGSAHESKLVHHADEAPLNMGLAFSCATCGIKYALTTQRNFKVHAVFAVLAIILGLVLQIPQWSWLAVILCITAVFSLEVINTAIEAVVDMVSPEWHELAMRAKDCAAGAVFIFAIGSIVVAAVVYVPAFIELIMRMGI